MLGREDATSHPAVVDAETGIANALHFQLVYRYLFHGADRGVPLTLMLLSTGGPDSEGLHALGEAFKRMTRASDLIAHLGDGYFILLLMGCNMSGGLIAADRFESALQEVTSGPVSIGLAAYNEDMEEGTELLEAVERTMKVAEAAGGGIQIDE